MALSNAPYPLYDVPSISDMRSFIEGLGTRFGSRTAFMYTDSEGNECSHTFTEFADHVFALATEFIERGWQKTTIAVIGENNYQWVIAYYATIISGNIVVPLDRDLSTQEIVFLLGNCQAKVLVHTGRYSSLRDQLQSEVPSLQFFVDMGERDSALRDMVAAGTLLRAAQDCRVEQVHYDVQECAAILYTSGTTGVSKGVMLSQRNFLADTAQTLKNIELNGTTLLVLPLHHSFSMMAVIYCTLHSGCTVAINSSLKNLNEDLLRYKPDFLFLVPMIVEALYKRLLIQMRRLGREQWFNEVCTHVDALYQCDVDVRDPIFKTIREALGGNLKLIVSGGAALDPVYIDRYFTLGIDVRNGYGITECSPVVSVNRNNHHRRDSIGQPVPGMDIMILDPNELGEGEICVKGDIVMLGYYNNPEATDAAFIDGWFRTGDIGTLEDGFLAISGRMKNIIILSNGKNIYPEELELHISNVAGVKEVLVYGQKGVITAEIFPDQEYLAEQGIENAQDYLQHSIDAINETLPRHKKIVMLKVRGTPFLRTSSNKIVRSQVQEPTE